MLNLIDNHKLIEKKEGSLMEWIQFNSILSQIIYYSSLLLFLFPIFLVLLLSICFSHHFVVLSAVTDATCVAKFFFIIKIQRLIGNRLLIIGLDNKK